MYAPHSRRTHLLEEAENIHDGAANTLQVSGCKKAGHRLVKFSYHLIVVHCTFECLGKPGIGVKPSITWSVRKQRESKSIIHQKNQVKKYYSFTHTNLRHGEMIAFRQFENIEGKLHIWGFSLGLDI